MRESRPNDEIGLNWLGLSLYIDRTMATPLERLRALVEAGLQDKNLSDEESAAALLALYRWADENPGKSSEPHHRVTTSQEKDDGYQS